MVHINPSNKATQSKMVQATCSWPHTAALWGPKGVARPLQPWIWAIQPDYRGPGHLHPCLLLLGDLQWHQAQSALTTNQSIEQQAFFLFSNFIPLPRERNTLIA